MADIKKLAKEILKAQEKKEAKSKEKEEKARKVVYEKPTKNGKVTKGRPKKIILNPKSETRPGMQLWRQVCNDNGYGNKKIPAKGTKEYEVLRKAYDKVKLELYGEVDNQKNKNVDDMLKTLPGDD